MAELVSILVLVALVSVILVAFTIIWIKARRAIIHKTGGTVGSESK